LNTRRIGDTSVSEIGFGAWNLSSAGRPPDDVGVRVIHAAIDAGMTLIDTADSYCIDENDFHHNEELIGRALRERPSDRQKVFIATKAGSTRPGGAWEHNGDPDYIVETCHLSLRALGVERIDLLQLHGPDEATPIERTMEGFARLKDEGAVRMVGISNVSVEQIDRAQTVVDVVSVQNEYSPYVLDDERNGVFAACVERGLAYLPYSPFGGPERAKDVGTQGAFRAVGIRHGVSPHRVVLAWLLARSPNMIPIPGARRIESVVDCAAAADLQLSDEEFRELNVAVGL
jgi:aryl-alcohol dehydrogenase-like predicted oxidoreductase